MLDWLAKLPAAIILPADCIPANQLFQFLRSRWWSDVVVRLRVLKAILATKFSILLEHDLLDVFTVGGGVVVAEHGQSLPLSCQPGTQPCPSLARRTLCPIGEVCRDFGVDYRADIHDAIYELRSACVIVFRRDRMRLQSGVEVLRVVFVSAGHPTGGFHSLSREVVVGVFFIRPPWVVTNHGIDSE